VSSWEKGYQEPCHALLELADDDLVRLLQTANLICQNLRGCAEILHREDGFTLRNEKGQTIEHFGYRDGISQLRQCENSRRSGRRDPRGDQ
jgi:deferrochelatase/peroxidase EfeB